MSPAELVIEKFGGARPLARELSIDHTSVLRWPKPREQRGSGGNIPSKYHAKILKLAEVHGIDLSANELIFGNRIDQKP